MTTMELRNSFEPPHSRFEERLCELREVESTISLVVDKLLPEDNQQPEDTDAEEVVGCLFMIRREIRRIIDDLREVHIAFCQRESEGGDYHGEAT